MDKTRIALGIVSICLCVAWSWYTIADAIRIAYFTPLILMPTTGFLILGISYIYTGIHINDNNGRTNDKS